MKIWNIVNSKGYKSLYSLLPRRSGSSLQVLLLENVVNRGIKGEVVKVKRGYFRNLLYPRKMAVYATPENMEKYKYVILERERQKAIKDTTTGINSEPSLMKESENA